MPKAVPMWNGGPAPRRSAVQTGDRVNKLLCGGLLERLGGARYQGAKRRLIADCQLGEHLAVDLDAGAGQTADEAAVGDVVLPAAGVDARDPELAEVALANAAVAIGVLPRAHHRLVGGLVGLA